MLYLAVLLFPIPMAPERVELIGLLEIFIDGYDRFEREVFDAGHWQRDGRVDEERVRRHRHVALRLDDDQKPPTLKQVAHEAAVGQHDRHFEAIRSQSLVDDGELQQDDEVARQFKLNLSSWSQSYKTNLFWNRPI